MNSILGNNLRTLVALVATLAITACTTTPKKSEPDDDDGFNRAKTTRSRSPVPVFRSPTAWKEKLGINRRPSDLGFSEKAFNPCDYENGENCDRKYLSVVNFQLLCRDSEGTVSEVPTEFQPVVTNRLQWSLADQNGETKTDSEGYGTFSIVTEWPVRGRRLILRNGRFYVGVSVSEINKLVLPKNWCE